MRSLALPGFSRIPERYLGFDQVTDPCLLPSGGWITLWVTAGTPCRKTRRAVPVHSEGRRKDPREIGSYFHWWPLVEVRNKKPRTAKRDGILVAKLVKHWRLFGPPDRIHKTMMCVALPQYR